MSHEISEDIGKPYGLAQVCWVFELPRSTIYAQQAWESDKGLALHLRRRGPKMADADLLAAIRAYLAAPPFSGEGAPQGLGALAHPARHSGFAYCA